jgi:butyrate kinase
MKMALFENEKEVFSHSAPYDMARMKSLAGMDEIVKYIKDDLMDKVTKANVSLKGVDAFVSRAMNLVGCEGGTYTINEKMLYDTLDPERPSTDLHDPHLTATPLAYQFAKTYGCIAIVVDPEDTDEMQEVARVTGLANVMREARYHPLNQKAVARRFADEAGKRYEDLNLVVAHMGGGTSISAHRQGTIIDTTDARQGDGPMAPSRTGALPALPVVQMCFSGKYTEKDMIELVTRKGGFIHHLGTADLRQVMEHIKGGDAYAKLIFDAMVYQIGKTIGAYATVLKGKVDAILLTGGMSNNEELVKGITEMVKFIAPVKVYAGEFESEAMVAGALRILNGQQQVKTYTGKPVWSGFKK